MLANKNYRKRLQSIYESHENSSPQPIEETSSPDTHPNRTVKREVRIMKNPHSLLFRIHQQDELNF